MRIYCPECQHLVSSHDWPTDTCVVNNCECTWKEPSPTCEHGYPRRWPSDRACPYTQEDGATTDNLISEDSFEITGRGKVYVIRDHFANKKGFVGRTINIDGKRMEVTGFESCLIPGHDEGHCKCFGGTGLLAKEVT